MDEENTRPVEVGVEALAHPYLELHVLAPDGSQQLLPFHEARLTIAEGWTAEASSRSVLVHGPDGAQELHPGECLQISGHNVWVVDARLPAFASLEGYGGEYQGRAWSLRPQPYKIGRRGASRVNQIELNHPTISRAQATLLPGGRNQVMLLNESPTSPTLVNGKAVPVGELTTLHHGDLLQFGELSLRFRQSHQEAAAGKLLSIQCLGRFELQWGDLSLSEGQLKSEKARWLLARLAWSWDQAVPVEQLMEMLWPELPALRGRKNLSQCLGTLRQALSLEEDEIFLRTPATLQLNPQHMAEHDARQVHLLSLSDDPAAWEKALKFYTGPYLPSCFDDWALEIREQLQQEVLQSALKLSRLRAGAGDWPRAVEAAQAGLALDPCDQELAVLLMEGHLHSGQPQAAVRCFQQVSKHLESQLGLEPSTEMLRAYQKARLSL
jgi:DNA-binding SARP family transcriptional activator